jgi:Cys-tRNA(Pro)/Cys-tRNA(Cys) deacylase
MTPAVKAARSAGIEFSVLEYEHDPAHGNYGLEAAQALGQPPEQVFKTLVARLPGGRLVVAIVPVARRLDLKALAAALGAKRADLAAPEEAQRATGYVVGGISPLGQRRRLPTVLDASADTHERIFVSGGRRGLEIGLSPKTLCQVCAAKTAQIAR